MQNIEGIGKLIGRTVISVESANKVGHVNDLLCDPLTGKLAGFSVETPDKTSALVSIIDVRGIGRDAVMIEHDNSLVLAEASPLNGVPRAKGSLIGVKVITEHGQLLGAISDVSLCLLREPVFVYEVRSSIFDKLLGHAFYFGASLGCAFSDDSSSLVVCDYSDAMEHSLEAAARRILGSIEVMLQDPAAINIQIRSHA